MTEGIVEHGKPELKTWSFENFGQVLKVSGSLEPEIFPYRVSLTKDCHFFKSIYNGLYKGEAATVFGSENGQHPVAKGVLIEHVALLAADDLGEVMISKEVFQGNMLAGLTDYSQKKMLEYEHHIENIPLSPGWRRFGIIHSHPIFDTLNSLPIPFYNVPKANGMGVSFSGGDFLTLVMPISQGFTKETVMGVITPIQLGFMVATKKTINVLKEKNENTKDLLKISKYGFAKYRNFEKLGLILYAGNHMKFGKDIILQRLLY